MTLSEGTSFTAGVKMEGGGGGAVGGGRQEGGGSKVNAGVVVVGVGGVDEMMSKAGGETTVGI